MFQCSSRLYQQFNHSARVRPVSAPVRPKAISTGFGWNSANIGLHCEQLHSPCTGTLFEQRNLAVLGECLDYVGPQLVQERPTLTEFSQVWSQSANFGPVRPRLLKHGCLLARYAHNRKHCSLKNPTRPMPKLAPILASKVNCSTTLGQRWGNFGSHRDRSGNLFGTRGEQLLGSLRVTWVSLPQPASLGPPTSKPSSRLRAAAGSPLKNVSKNAQDLRHQKNDESSKIKCAGQLPARVATVHAVTPASLLGCPRDKANSSQHKR